MRFSAVKNNLLIILLLVVGTVVWSSTMVKSGLIYDYGMGFWGANGHDAIWHIAIIKSLTTGSLAMPILAGESIQNYHLGFDALVAFIHIVTKISVINMYFQILPPIFALLIGILTYKVVAAWQQSKTAAWWSVFFVYFGTGFGWLAGLGDSAFWAQQSLSTLINPPFALSLLLILAGLWSLQKKKYAVAIVCFGLLTEVKVYAGFLCLAGLFVASLKEKALVKVWLGSLCLAVPLFLLTNSHASGLIMWQPGWFLETLFAPDRLDMPKFFSALNTYRVGHIWFKAVPAFAVAFVIFFIGNSGTRILGLLSLKMPTWFEKMSLVIIVLGALVPMLIVQKGTPWNTIQFFYYSLFFLSLFAGVTVARLLKSISRPSLRLLIGLFCLVLALPEITGTLSNYLPSRPPAKISTSELKALSFLSTQPHGTVLSIPFNRNLADAAIPNPPRPLYLYESTAYISALSGQASYLADEVNLNITGFSVNDRRSQSSDFFSHPTREFLVKNNITYIYLTPGQSDNFSLVPGLDLIYNTDLFNIYKFDASIGQTIHISSDHALQMVSELPEIKKYLEVPGSHVAVDGYSNEKEGWVIRVYKDLNTDIGTLKSFYVSAETGTIYDMYTNQPVTPLAPR